jgi:protein SCO1/2
MAAARGMIGLAAAAAVVVAVGAAMLAPRFTTAKPQAIHIGGPFSLVDGSGHKVTDQDYRGRWLLVYFGYTHCPDACPTTLSELSAGLDKMALADRDKVRVLFITVDPARDTPSVIGAYAHAFGPQFVGLTGTQAQLAPVEASYHVYAQRHALKGGDYAMDHSSIVYVMRPDGSFAGLLDDGLSSQDIAKALLAYGA